MIEMTQDNMTLQEVLRGGRQCDEDGSEIIMSREACCVAADELDSLQAATLKRDAENAELKQAHDALFATSQEMNADLVALRKELEAVRQNIQYCDEDTTYRNIGEFLDNNQPNIGDTFDLTEIAFIRNVSFKCVEVDGSIEALEIDAAMQSGKEATQAKAQPQSPLHDMDAKIKAWYSRHYDNMRKHMPEYSELELEAHLGSARMHYIEGFSDARLAHLMNEQSATNK